MDAVPGWFTVTLEPPVPFWMMPENDHRAAPGGAMEPRVTSLFSVTLPLKVAVLAELS